MKKPLVSVVMGVWNGERYLDQALESICSQTYSHIECIVIDDGSTDNTAALLRAWQDRDDRISIVLQKENTGLSHILEKACGMTTGTYIARMDSDDVSHPDRIASQVAYMEAHPEYVVCGTWYKEIDEHGTILAKKQLPQTHDDIRATLMKYNPMVHGSVLIRRSAYVSSGGYDAQKFSKAQDYDLWFRMIQLGKFVNIPAYLFSRRYSDESMSRHSEHIQLRCALKARYKAIQAGIYPISALRYIVRPLFVLLLPNRIRKWLRTTFLKNNLYA